MKVAALLLLLASPAVAKTLRTTVFWIPQGECFRYASIPLQQLKWSCLDPTLDYWGMYAVCDAFMLSLTAAMHAYCPPGEFDHAWERIAEWGEEAKTTAPMPNREALLAKLAEIGPLPTVDIFAPGQMGGNHSEPIMITKEAYDVGEHTDVGFMRMMYYDNCFGWAMFLLMAVMVLIGVTNRIHHLLRRRMYASDPEGRPSHGSRLGTWYEKHLRTPALWGERHLQATGWGFLSIPTRIQGLLIFIYVALNFIFSFVGYDVFEKNLYWYQEEDQQIARFVADRTGVMSFYNMVLLWALAGRNDILIWLTGWSFQNMNLFHRWTARVAVLQAIVHSAAYTWLERENLAEDFKVLYWATGVFGMVTMSIILPLSFRPVREKAYEIFLILHILLAAATLILMYYHVLDFGYLAWIWACVGLWAFDRFVRLVRIALLSYRTLGKENAVARMTATGGLIRVSVRATGSFKPKPGQYYFLYEPRSLTPWENHPFTLASWNTTGRGTELEFLVAPMKGWTRRLQRRIDRANGPARMRLLLEGPYGHDTDLTGFEHVLLVAGGSGITGVLPYLFSLGHSDRKRRIHFVWAARTAEYAADVLSNELVPEKRGHASLQLHFTRDAGTPTELVKVISRAGDATPTDKSDRSDKDDQSSTDATDGASTKAKPRSGSAILTHRPEMRTVLADAVADVVGGERLAVLVCGPFAMCDDLRQAVVETYGQGPGQLPAAQLSYFEEAFGW